MSSRGPVRLVQDATVCKQLVSPSVLVRLDAADGPGRFLPPGSCCPPFLRTTTAAEHYASPLLAALLSKR